MNEECSFLSFIFLQYDLSDCEKKNAEEQLLLCFNYSPNYHNNLVTLSQVLEQKTPAPDRTDIWSFYLANSSMSVSGALNFFPVTFAVAQGICLYLQSCYYILPHILLLRHCVISVWLFNISSSFQKPSPEQYVILPWLLDGNGSYTCLERGAHSPG